MKPDIFNVTRFVTMALILACTTLLFSSCTHSKASQKESLYGHLNASNGTVHTAYVKEYIGQTTLYTQDEECRPIKAFMYASYLPIQRNGREVLIDDIVYCYEPIQASEHITYIVNGLEVSEVAVEARNDLSRSSVTNWPTRFIFLAGVESDAEAAQHLRTATDQP